MHFEGTPGAQGGFVAGRRPGGQVADETTPAFRVVRGTPTAEELAALVGVLFSRRPATPAAPSTAPSRWRASALPTTPLRAGAGGWRASGLPSR
jgi:hypothetical protein